MQKYTILLTKCSFRQLWRIIIKLQEQYERFKMHFRKIYKYVRYSIRKKNFNFQKGFFLGNISPYKSISRSKWAFCSLYFNKYIKSSGEIYLIKMLWQNDNILWEKIIFDFCKRFYIYLIYEVAPIISFVEMQFKLDQHMIILWHVHVYIHTIVHIYLGKICLKLIHVSLSFRAESFHCADNVPLP